MPVSTPNREYTNNLELWGLVRDCVKGSAAIKGGRAAVDERASSTSRGTRYLPKPNPEDLSNANQSRYAAYRERASFVNFTGHTKDGFIGMISRKKTEIVVPAQIDYVEKNASGSGRSLDEMIMKTISELLEVARQGLLVDFPQSEGGTQAQTQSLRSSIKVYPTESIISWREEVINGVTTLTSVTLVEMVEKPIAGDQFVFEVEKQFRVLSLENGIYLQRVYDKDDKLISGDIVPKKSDKSTWDEIPFVFPGAIDNGPSPDKAPLYDLAEINIAHYRNSADFEESSFLVGQPTPTMTGLTQAWVDSNLKTGVQFGSRTLIMGPEGAEIGLLQASENQMPSKGMEMKEIQMVKIGAKIIADSGGVETAEAAKIRFSGQNSKLGLVVKNTELAYEQCLVWVGMFMGTDQESIIEINKQFYEATINPQLLTAKMMLMDRAVITKTDVRDYMRKSGLIDPMRTDEDIDNEAGEVDPLV